MASPIKVQTENIFKDARGMWRTASLFWEYRREGYTPMFVLKDEDACIDGVDIPSLKQIYLSYDHVPGYEYEFANEVLGGWKHWQRLVNSNFLKAVFIEWREELEVLLKAKALRVVLNTAVAGEGASRLNAAKYLSDKGYAPTRGRPSKEEKARALKQDAQVTTEIEDDLERVGLKLINKGKR